MVPRSPFSLVAANESSRDTEGYTTAAQFHWQYELSFYFIHVTASNLLVSRPIGEDKLLVGGGGFVVFGIAVPANKYNK
jgi:hypothetical protein